MRVLLPLALLASLAIGQEKLIVDSPSVVLVPSPFTLSCPSPHDIYTWRAPAGVDLNDQHDTAELTAAPGDYTIRCIGYSIIWGEQRVETTTYERTIRVDGAQPTPPPDVDPPDTKPPPDVDPPDPPDPPEPDPDVADWTKVSKGAAAKLDDQQTATELIKTLDEFLVGASDSTPLAELVADVQKRIEAALLARSGSSLDKDWFAWRAAVNAAVGTAKDSGKHYLLFIQAVRDGLEASAVNAPKRIGVITIFSRQGCPACEQWKREEEPRFRRAGFRVQYGQDQTGKPVPWFELDYRGQVRRFEGFLTPRAFNSLYGILAK